MSLTRFSAGLLAVLILFAIPQVAVMAHEKAACADAQLDKALYTDAKACGSACTKTAAKCDACTSDKACDACAAKKAAACGDCSKDKACDACAPKKSACCDKEKSACKPHGCDHKHVCTACNSLANTHGDHASRSSNVGHHGGDCCEKPECRHDSHHGHGACCDGHDHHCSTDDCNGHHDCGWFGGHHHCKYGHLTVAEQTRN